MTIEITVRDGRTGREGGGRGAGPRNPNREGYGQGAVLKTFQAETPLAEGDRLTLDDGTEVVVIGFNMAAKPGETWKQTVHVGNIFDEPQH